MGVGSAARAEASIAALARLKGIGANDATLLTREVFYRQFRNRREFAGWASLTPTPWAGGHVERDRGIGRDGTARIRASSCRWHGAGSAFSPAARWSSGSQRALPVPGDGPEGS